MNQHAKFVREMEILHLFGTYRQGRKQTHLSRRLSDARALRPPRPLQHCTLHTHHRSPWQPLRLRQQPQAHSVQQQRHSSLPSARRRRPGVHFDHPLAATPNRHVPCASTTRFLPHISSRLEGIGHICFSFFFHLLATRSRCKLLNS